MHKLFAILLTLTVVVAACGNDDDTDATDTGTEPAEETTTTTAEATTTTTAALVPPPYGEGSDEAAIAGVVELAFNSNTPDAEAAAAYEQTPQTEPILAAAAEGGGSDTSAEVTGVAVMGDVAKVEFTLNTATFGAIPGQQGSAILVEGEWKVSLHTLCTLLELVGAPPECAQVSDPLAA